MTTESRARAARSSGVLLPVSALAGASPVGDFGPAIDRWLAWLREAGQSSWQVLPLGTTAAYSGNSPYSALSAFAIDPVYISLEALAAEGWLERTPEWGERASTADYESARERKAEPLGRTFEAWRDGGRRGETEYEEFLRANAGWLPDYALFMALRRRHGTAWFDWPPELRDRDAEAIARVRESEAERIELETFLQFVADRQWRTVRRRAADAGIELFGDLPIYVSMDSADVWAERAAFRLDAAGRPEAVAGVPPDYYSETGQRWGNPLYRWKEMADGGYRWWLDRLRRNASLFDLVRIDHFRGFASHWEIAADAPDAVNGEWVAGPGAAFFDAVAKALPDMRLVAEDLGVITDDVHELRRAAGLAGIRVLQFGFGEGFPDGEHLPHCLARETVLYTGTHDNNTLVGWYGDELSDEERDRVARYAGRALDRSSVAEELCRIAQSSVADRAVLPLQDVLGLGSEARFNAPGTAQGNWDWRVSEDALTTEHAARLRGWVEVYGRRPTARADSGATGDGDASRPNPDPPAGEADGRA